MGGRHFGQDESETLEAERAFIEAVRKVVSMKQRLLLDFDKIAIVAVFAAANGVHPSETSQFGKVQGTGDEIFPERNGSAVSLARHLGIPRESTRRKLSELFHAGWLVRENRTGQYKPSQKLLVAVREVVNARPSAEG